MSMPGFLTVERAFIRDIIDEKYSHSSSVVSSCDSPKTLLTCCIPYLELDALTVELDRANLKVNTDGCYK